jgi:2-hydroxychromene-2-carboxylate isomerase
MPLQFWFDFASTYSYPAAMRIESVAQARHVDIDWHAFLLGPIFHAQGWNDSPFNIYPAKGRYMWRDLERICQSLKISFRRPSVFPRNGVLAARIVTRFSGAEWIPDFIRAVYHANFVDDRDIAAPAVIGDCLQITGLDGAAIIAAATATESKQLFRAQTRRAIEQNIFGAPTFISNDELFWGNDRLEPAVEWHSRQLGGS